MKVDIRSRSPRLWGWSLHGDGSDNLVQRSEAAYGCADDAWTAGQTARASFESALSPQAMAEAEEIAA